MSNKQSTLDEFNKNYEAQNKEDKAAVASGEYDERETLRAERDQIYSGYIIESSQDGIEGKYGTNTAIRLTSPEGTKVTLWVNGYEEEHFNAFMEKLDKKQRLLETSTTVSVSLKSLLVKKFRWN